MAVRSKLEVEPTHDYAVAEAAGGGGGGAAGSGDPDFLNAVGVLGQGLPAPSFTVVAADMKNSSFKVLRPYVIVVGVGEVTVGGSRSFSFGDTVWCNVSKEADGFDGEGGAAFTWTANLSTDEDDDAELSVKIAEIPAWTQVFRMGGVQQYHVGAIIVGSGSGGTVSTETRTVVTGVKATIDSNDGFKLVRTMTKIKVVADDSSDSGSSDKSWSESDTVASLLNLTVVQSSVYDPGDHQFINHTRSVWVVADAENDESDSEVVFQTEPVCRQS